MIKSYYLNVPEQLSQVYLHSYSIIIVLIIVKIFLFKRAILESLSELSDHAEDICQSANNFSSSLSDAPKKLSESLNSVIVSQINNLVLTWLKVIILLGKVIKNLIIFYIEIFLGTMTCLITAAVTGTVNFALDSSESVVKTLNSTIVGLTDDIQDGLKGLTSIINSLISSFEKVKSFFTGNANDYDPDKYTSKVNLSITSLRKLSIPSSVLTNIENFKKEVPNFTEVENEAKDLIFKPFDLISKKISSSQNFKNITTSELPTLKSFDSVNFCNESKELTDLIEHLSSLISKVATIILVVLCVLLLLDVIAIGVLEFIKNRKFSRMAESFETSNNLRNALVNSRKSNFMFLYRLNRIFTKVSESRKIKILWLINYCTTSFAFNVLLISLAGFFAVALQFIILRILKSLKIDKYTDIVNKSLSNDTAAYVKNLNVYFADEESKLNKELFGYIKDTSSSINSTLNTFMSHLNETITVLFNSTPFQKPIETVIYCTIGRKVATIEKGLTWINNNVQINIPTISKELQKEIIDSQNFAINLKLADLIKRSLNKIIKFYQNGLWIELYICFGFFGLWILQVIIGCIILCIKEFYNKDIVISEPMPLTEFEKQQYGYPLTDPINDISEAGSSVYSHLSVKNL